MHVMKPHTAVLGKILGTSVYRSTKQYPDADRVPGILILRIDSPLFFANSSYLQERIIRWIEDEKEQDHQILRYVVLDMGQECSPSIDVDTSLLLKTLDFPPLTWVVQGFDIDLQPSEAPMHYLQRYISAPEQAGDRTLETLFSHGISCYTLRTPADLNSLRERYGSKALAAEEELFYSLHPKYLMDVQNLRKAAFGNLTAKGGQKLTGKRLAKLLPLLVHYVNEDFPLSADRKLRDVLVDVIIDGAFAGGVQYFEKAMQSAFSRPENLNFSGRGLSFDSENLEALSASAMSAITSQEFNEIIAAAEKKAIDYCHRRCVGVPSVLVSSACEISLGTKIDRMKPFFREKNDRQVWEVLVRLGETLREEAEKILFSINLPIRETEIQDNCSKVINDALKS